MVKTLKDKCGLCGCEREYHEEGLGMCFNCNELQCNETGCMGFREDYDEEVVKQYKKERQIWQDKINKELEDKQ